MKIFNPQKDQEVIGSKCKACQKTFYGKNSTNLKAHLEKFHPDISKVITSKSVLVLFPVSTESPFPCVYVKMMACFTKIKNIVITINRLIDINLTE